MKKENVHDVVVIGGGAAGLTAATVLARTHSSVVLIDAGAQSNRVSHAVGAAFTRDGTTPEELYRIGREQLLAYPAASLIDNTVVSVVKDDIFSLTLASGTRVQARKLLLAQGMSYTLPAIEGIRELWGKKIWHCPYCHGYEATGKKILVIVDEERQGHLKKILPSWTSDFSFVEPDSVDRIYAEGDDVAILLKTGDRLLVQEVMTQTVLVKRDAIAESLGCAFTEQGHVQVDPMGKTTIAGVFAAGDQSSFMTQLNIAVASGHIAGVSVHQELCSEKE